MGKKKQDSKAIAKYKKENYDRINVDLPKGEREIIKEHVDARGISMQAFIRQAIYAAINEDRERMLNPPEPYVPREVPKEEIKKWRPLVPANYTSAQIKEMILRMDREAYESRYTPKRPTKLRKYNVWRYEYETGEDVDALAAQMEYEDMLAREAEERKAQEDAYHDYLMQQQFYAEEAAHQAQLDAMAEAEAQDMWEVEEAAHQAQLDAMADAEAQDMWEAEEAAHQAQLDAMADAEAQAMWEAEEDARQFEEEAYQDYLAQLKDEAEHDPADDESERIPIDSSDLEI